MAGGRYQKINGMVLHLLISLLLLVTTLPEVSCSGGHSHVSGCGGECVDDHDEDKDASLSQKLKIVGMVCIFVGSAVGILIPLLGRRFRMIKPDSSIFFPIKAFAAGIILATAMVHMLPVGVVKLGSPCLKEHPWKRFPFATFIAMLAAVATFLIENAGASYYNRLNRNKARLEAREAADVVDSDVDPQKKDVESNGDGGHVHGNSMMVDGETLRHRVVSQILELGIVSHSVIIGMNLGTLQSPSTIKALIGALTFHQFFEGMALGGCLIQAKFRMKAIIMMAIPFCLTTPIGVAIGVGITSSYDENSRIGLIIEGVFGATSAGILIYASLVDLLATDFSNSKLQSNGKLQLISYVALLLGLASMSIIGKWA